MDYSNNIDITDSDIHISELISTSVHKYIRIFKPTNDNPGSISIKQNYYVDNFLYKYDLSMSINNNKCTFEYDIQIDNNDSLTKKTIDISKIDISNNQSTYLGLW